MADARRTDVRQSKRGAARPHREPRAAGHLPAPNEGRPVNPNTPEGEIRNVAAFAAAVHGASPRRRAAAKAIVWLILLGMGISILVAVVTGVHAL